MAESSYGRPRVGQGVKRKPGALFWSVWEDFQEQQVEV